VIFPGSTGQQGLRAKDFVLSQAIEYSNDSHGLFDITIGPLVDLWDYKNRTVIPPKEQITKTLSLVGYHSLLLDRHGMTAKLQHVGQSIDLGGIGKGYASDCFMEIFKEYDIVSAYSNIGGNVSTLGNKPDGSPWIVGIRHPRRDTCLIGAAEVTGKAVVTSGDYERYFIDSNGKRWHHILNPVTGYPAKSGLVSATVISNSAMKADALSTIMFVSGMESGLEILKKYPEAEAVLVDEKLQIYITQGLKRSFKAISGVNVNIL
jgi:FAD:protein FMN transferase